MTGAQEKVLGAIAGISLGAQLIMRTQEDKGPLYWPIIVVLSAIAFGAVLWIYLGRRRRT